MPSYRISGHESFPCRYTWLPKAVRGLKEEATLFMNEDEAMVKLGLGKNMVRSSRFWAQSAGMVEPAKEGKGLSPSAFGSALLCENGFDPFLEDIRTLWLIHWKLSTNRATPLLAWDFLLNRWQTPEFTPSAAISALKKELALQENTTSDATLEQHFETFLHTYTPTRGRKGEVQEDNLDCPLVELDLIYKKGERPPDENGGRGESIYAFRRDEKPDISPELFLYCLNDFWTMQSENSNTLDFSQVAHGYGSPGQVFKLEEQDLRERLDGLSGQTKGAFVFAPSADLEQVRRDKQFSGEELLRHIYNPESSL
jgi:hypothetical protein